MRVHALLVAAGRGSRAGDGPSKPYRAVAGRSVLARSADAFVRHPAIDVVRVVVRPEDAALCAAALSGAPPGLRDQPIFGGDERQDSVRLGLETMAAEDPPDLVLIHDAARPFVSRAVIDRVIAALLDGAPAALAAVPVVDTLRRADAAGPDAAPLAEALVDRAGLWRAQTPQGFQFALIREAHLRFAETPVTDDAELARLAGAAVRLVEGGPENVKLTTPADFAFAETLAAGLDGPAAPPAPRVGHGYDVHKFGDNADGSADHVMLCGVRVPHEAGLVGHSDADVGLHALTDAILGAIGDGDIGAHFPPTDPLWRGAASETFLRHAAGLVGARGGRLTHLDVTLICERPKIRPHVAAMRARIAQICGLPIDQTSVKATTSEGLGFTGRREGIAAAATATVLL